MIVRCHGYSWFQLFFEDKTQVYQQVNFSREDLAKPETNSKVLQHSRAPPLVLWEVGSHTHASIVNQHMNDTLEQLAPVEFGQKAQAMHPCQVLGAPEGGEDRKARHFKGGQGPSGTISHARLLRDQALTLLREQFCPRSTGFSSTLPLVLRQHPSASNARGSASRPRSRLSRN